MASNNLSVNEKKEGISDFAEQKLFNGMQIVII